MAGQLAVVVDHCAIIMVCLLLLERAVPVVVIDLDVSSLLL